MEEVGDGRTHNWGVKWTSQEDQKLLEGFNLYGDSDWRSISELVGTRGTVPCIQRWEKVLRPGLVKGKWTDEEDELLRVVVSEGYDHWGKVADKMPGRTSKQCRERWANYLDPSLLKTTFSPKEDELLLRLQSGMGNKWACIARQVKGRTENSVKLRYHALMKAYSANSAPLYALGGSGNAGGSSSGSAAGSITVTPCSSSAAKKDRQGAEDPSSQQSEAKKQRLSGYEMGEYPHPQDMSAVREMLAVAGSVAFVGYQNGYPAPDSGSMPYYQTIAQSAGVEGVSGVPGVEGGQGAAAVPQPVNGQVLPAMHSQIYSLVGEVRMGGVAGPAFQPSYDVDSLFMKHAEVQAAREEADSESEV
ncbi:Homeodomain-like protein [Ochromonadaceae sp. CCMP2298]|nr:Homeodomain-like protein [Ochromonadaceae sp. CCMP2298]